MFCSYFNSIDTLDKGKGAFKAGALGAMKTNVFHTVKILTFGLFAVYLKKGGIKPKVYVSSLCFLFILHTHVKRKTMSLFCFHIHAYYLFYSLWFA